MSRMKAPKRLVKKAAKKPAKKVVAKKVKAAPKAKKVSHAASVSTPKEAASANEQPTAPAAAKKAVKVPKEKPDPVVFFRIMSLVVSPAGVFGLGNDNLVYLWDTLTATWKLHREGQ